jgi:hypothetical protein
MYMSFKDHIGTTASLVGIIVAVVAGSTYFYNQQETINHLQQLTSEISIEVSELKKALVKISEQNDPSPYAVKVEQGASGPIGPKGEKGSPGPKGPKGDTVPSSEIKKLISEELSQYISSKSLEAAEEYIFTAKKTKKFRVLEGGSQLTLGGTLRVSVGSSTSRNCGFVISSGKKTSKMATLELGQKASLDTYGFPGLYLVVVSVQHGYPPHCEFVFS